MRESFCGQNISSACSDLGVIFRDDRINESIKFFTKGCRLGHPNSCGNLGYLYGQKKKNLKKAKTYYLLACAMESSSGCEAAGVLLFKEKNIDGAIENFAGL